MFLHVNIIFTMFQLYYLLRERKIVYSVFLSFNYDSERALNLEKS